ncbi:unnamed protein product [Cuscuta epithymum]|nr:unnamed protein product [Cuscuta epithymum]CAH9120720.1 unnamed protein product [Cuscuta epithymum]
MRQWVFTLGVDQSWREIECIQFYHANCCFHHFFHSVQIDRIIYSFNWKFGSSRPANIAAFDVCAESTHIISFPNDFSSQCSHRMSSGLIMRSALVDLDGRLAILHISKVDDRKYSMVIWKMEKCMVWEQLAIAIPLEASQMIHRCLLRVTTNHFGEVMLFLIGRSKTIFVLVLLYNFKSQVWRKLDIHGLLDKPSPCFWDTAVMHVIVDNLFSVAGGSSNRPLAYAG